MTTGTNIIMKTRIKLIPMEILQKTLSPNYNLYIEFTKNILVCSHKWIL